MEILLRLGFLIDFISVPVIAGFTSAAAITIASSQVLMMVFVVVANIVVVIVMTVAIAPTKEVLMTETEQRLVARFQVWPPGEGLAGGGD